jgi:hypothetical protein
VTSNHLFSCCRQLWGKIHWRRTCPAPPTNSAKILYLLIQKGREKILRTHHQMGLCWQKAHLLMPSYVEKALKRFQHPPPIVPQDQPHQHVKRLYGAKVQQANPLDTSPPLNKAGKKFIQEVMGEFLYLAQAVNSTMLTALSSLASKQVTPTEKTMQKCLQILDYAASQVYSIITYQVSNMRLAIHSNASYPSEPKARSKAGGHIFMVGMEDIPINNGVVLNISQIIRAVMSPDPQKPNLAHCSSTPKWQSPCNALLRKWDTRKLALPSKPTTCLPTHYSPTKFCPRR